MIKAKFVHSIVTISTNIPKTLWNFVSDEIHIEGKTSAKTLWLERKDRKILFSQRICNTLTHPS
jgi:hypothetical protein